jgi:hypothetical protein
MGPVQSRATTRAAGYFRTEEHHPIHFEDLGVPKEQARSAFRDGYLMRYRFSIADLLNFIGWPDDAFVDDVFAQMNALVGRHASLSP